jgi:AmmeMemoRadiSam system protein B
VAGSFYPGDPERLAADVDAYLAEATTDPTAPTPKALIAPHAGYVYSGSIAGSAYRLLLPLRERVRRIVLIGPAHRIALQGLAASQADAFETPLGKVRVDRDAVAKLLELPQVVPLEAAHATEHSLEVQLPFLQRVLADFELVPLVAGDASAEDVAEVLELCWGGDETRIVISSDLSHYHAYAEARRLDAATTRAIEALDPAALGSDSACGRVPVRGLLLAAQRHGLRARAIDVRNSGDTAGPADRVVGYGSYAFA